jgi:hypothetical protein
MNGECIDRVMMINTADGQSITVHYPPPVDPTTQRFILESRGGRWIELQIGRDETIWDVKRRLLYEIGSHESLPGLLTLSFYGCPLGSRGKFIDYGIPENSVIDVTDTLHHRGASQVRWGSSSTTFNFALLDTVSDLELALRRMKGDQCRDFVLFNGSVRLMGNSFLTHLGQFEAEVVELFRFESADQKIEIPLRVDSTVCVGREALATYLSVESSLIQLHSGNSPITDLSQLIWKIGDPIHFSITPSSYKFVFAKREIELTVDVQLPIKYIESIVCRGLGISPPIFLFLNKAELDRDTPLADFELTATDVIEVSTSPMLLSNETTSPPDRPAAPSCRSYAISLFLGIVPRIASYELLPTATLTEIEPRMQQRYDLGDLELDFYLWDAATDDQEMIPKSTVIGSLDIGDRALIARPATITATAPPAGAAAEPGTEAEADVAELQSRFDALHVTVGSSASANPAYAFSCDNPSDEFTLRLPIGAKVGDARVEVAKRYGKPLEAISFQFMGKTLRDAFVMDRLRLGTAKIFVHILDDSDVILLTSKANRMGR